MCQNRPRIRKQITLNHDLQAVTKNHRITPIAIVPAPPDTDAVVREAFEIGERVELPGLTSFLLLARRPYRAVDGPFGRALSWR